VLKITFLRDSREKPLYNTVFELDLLDIEEITINFLKYKLFSEKFVKTSLIPII
jgi:hypothetical protein